MRTWLDIDVGELADEPEALYEAADLVNIACGGHAGDDASMTLALQAARRWNARIAAHPSYPDRAGFGRVEIRIEPKDLRESVRSQCAALAAIARTEGLTVEWLKPHGALYHRADADPEIAAAVLEGAIAALGRVGVVGPANGELQRGARARDLPYLREGFADRGIGEDGRLIPRGRPGAVLTDPTLAAAQARSLLGTVDVLCVHGDQPAAVAVARAVRAALEVG